jgi:hypothetical protein
MGKTFYSDFCFDTWNRTSKDCYLQSTFEMEGPHGVQNDRNGHIMAGERWLKSAQILTFGFIPVFLMPLRETS